MFINPFGSVISKVLGISTAALIIICAVLYFTMSSVNGKLTEKNQELMAEVSSLEIALQQNEAALEAAVEERRRIEDTLTQRILNEKKTTKIIKAQLENESKKLAKLREEYDELEEFFDIVAPDAFVDNCMQSFKRADNNNQD